MQHNVTVVPAVATTTVVDTSNGCYFDAEATALRCSAGRCEGNEIAIPTIACVLGLHLYTVLRLRSRAAGPKEGQDKPTSAAAY